jgi:hypothetical protein
MGVGLKKMASSCNDELQVNQNPLENYRKLNLKNKCQDICVKNLTFVYLQKNSLYYENS